MCCCCCPPAISALFCLYVQSGCSKGTVAGALTFFPPEPALYQFERHAADGRVLKEDEEATLPEIKEQKKKETTDGLDDDVNDDDESSVGAIKGPRRTGPLEVAETRVQTVKKMKSPIEQLAEQAAVRRRRSKVRNARDGRDERAGVKYRLLLDPRLSVPPHDEHAIEAVKISSPKGVYLAAVIYRIPAERRTEKTKTIVMCHGNATDNGAMFPIQVVLAHSLDCNVVVYDYSGYGESGGVPSECATYRDMQAVYDYVIENHVANSPKNVVLYGQSVGSGPCCYLAAKKDEIVGGMILHSPFTSGMRVLTPSRYVFQLALQNTLSIFYFSGLTDFYRRLAIHVNPGY
jgi:pimeloyl-ACP methyl ester carboxylesterase